MPYIETALFGDDESSNIIHFGIIRLRATGAGKLRPTFIGYDDQQSEVLLPLTMSSAPGKELTRTANFKGQRARLRLETNKIHDYAKIDKIILFTKQLWTSYPQTE